MDWSTLERFSFGDNPALADELGELVLSGRKRATCWAASEGEKTAVGTRMVMCDGAGRPRAVIETLELATCRYSEVGVDFARDEGEGDGSLEYWRDAHRTYFKRNGGFSPDMLLWCERFRLVDVIEVVANQRTQEG